MNTYINNPYHGSTIIVVEKLISLFHADKSNESSYSDHLYALYS